jgi:predicted DNA-binding transcriptional regulator AlpA
LQALSFKRQGFFFSIPPKNKKSAPIAENPQFPLCLCGPFLTYGGHMEPLLDINDVAEITKIKKATLRRYVLLKQIPFHKVIKAIRFRASEITAWVNNNGRMEGLEIRPIDLELQFGPQPSLGTDSGDGESHDGN